MNRAIDEFFYPYPKEVLRICELLNGGRYSVKNGPFSYRVINHYEKKGLLINYREKEGSWRQFNGYDLIWLFVLNELRNFGLPITVLQKLHGNLFHEGGLGTIDIAKYINRPFQIEIAYSIFENHKLFLVVFSSGAFTFYDNHSKNQWESASYNNESHISIPLWSISKNVWDQLKVGSGSN